MEHILNLEQVKKYYGGNSGNITKAVDGISMYVDKGEFVAIMGASNILAGAVILVLAGALVVNAIPSIIALFSAGAGTVFGLLIQAL